MGGFFSLLSLMSDNSTSLELYAVINCSSDAVAECTRVVLLMFLFFFTLLGCLAQMTRIFINTKQLFSYQMAVLLLVAIESFLGFIHYGFFNEVAYNYWIIYLKELELLIITYFFLLYALIASDKRHLDKMVLWPVFGSIVIYLTLVVVLGTADVFKNLVTELDCSNITFLLLSSSGLLLSTVFLGAGVLITRKLKKQSISENIRKKKSLELWALIFVYFIVSLTSMGVDVFDQILSYSTGSCSMFQANSWPAAVGSLLERLLDTLVPMWAILIVYDIEARRAKGKDLRKIRELTSSDPESNAFEVDFADLVGGPYVQGQYHSIRLNSDEKVPLL